MRLFTLLLLFLFITCSADAQTDTTGNYFTVLYKTGKNWNTAKAPAEQVYFKEHSEFLADLRRRNIIKAGARYSDVGMLIIKAINLSEAEKLIRSDAAVKNELFVVSVFEANFFYKGCIE